MSADLLPALDTVLEQGGEPDDVLRSVVSVLVDAAGIDWAGIAFHEEDELVLGPEAGEPDEVRRVRVPVLFQGGAVGELWVDGEADRGLLDEVAVRVAPYVLIGWDTGGERWEP
jgi:putative methionine-R-sulfoxide reductase with GAF domain